MIYMYRYTNSNMAGWDFIKLDDKAGIFYSGNSASTVESMTNADLRVTVKSKSQLRAIREQLLSIGFKDGGKK